MNPYAGSRPDFRALAAKSERLARVVVPSSQHDRPSPKLTIDFKDPESSIALTEAILEHDFGIHVTLRDDRLCPPVPNRLAYLDWVREILSQTQETARCIASIEDRKVDQDESVDSDRPSKRMKKKTIPQIRILDIGTGASCIYPLLGCAMNDEWEFIGTDIDSLSIQSGQRIVDDPRNNDATSRGRFTKGRNMALKARIHLLLRNEEDPPLLLDESDIDGLKLDQIPWSRTGQQLLYHAAMCNPPFYSSIEEMQTGLEMKAEAPNAVCLGSTGEMICPGGEVEFIGRMIVESKKLQNKVLWFTSLIGKQSSIEALHKRFVDDGITNVHFSPLETGHTVRYAVGWTFMSYRPHQIKTLSVRSSGNRMRRVWHEGNGAKIGLATVQKVLDDLSIPWTSPTSPGDILALPSRKTWGREGRRSRDRGGSAASSHVPIVGILLQQAAGREIVAQWAYGQEESHFHSVVSAIQKGIEKVQDDV